MSDEDQESANLESTRRHYSDEERITALAAVDLNGGNVYRTAIAMGIPARTLADWVEDRAGRAEEFAEQRKERRGDLGAKLESLLHSLIEAMPAKIPKASLAQAAVASGIAIDKLIRVRSQGLEPDPATELCRLLGINAQQLPQTLELHPGEKIAGFGAVIETEANAEGRYEPVSQSRYRHRDFGVLLSAHDQSNLPPGYIRLLDPQNQVFVFSANDLELMPEGNSIFSPSARDDESEN